MKTTSQCSCIIPFYNEGDRLINELEQLTKVKNINQIICVDDGSTNKLRDKIRINFPQVQLITTLHHGKSQAIFAGLEKSTQDIVLLLDADLTNLNSTHIETGIKMFFKYQQIGMLIFSHVNAPLESSWARADTVFSGDRLLRKADVLRIFKQKKPKGYQFEIAANQYMIDCHKKVLCYPSSAINTFKRIKLGLIKGLITEMHMHLGMMRYAGVTNYIKQCLFFARENIKIPVSTGMTV